MAATEDEGLCHGGVRWADRERGVIHVLVEEIRVVMAGGGYRGDVGVKEEVRWDIGFFCWGGGGGWLEACEVVDGGAYRV